MNKKCRIGFIGSCLLSCISAWAGTKAPITQKDWAQFLGRQDMEFTHPLGDTWGHSVLLADGWTGASVYRLSGEPWTLRWELGRTDVAAEYHIKEIDWSIPRVPIGNILLKPDGEVTNAFMRLDLWNAEGRGTIETEAGPLRWRSFIEHETDVVLIEVSSAGATVPCSLDFAEEWSVSPRFFATETDPETYTGDQLPPKPYREQQGDVSVVVQPLTKHGAHATAWVCMEKMPGQKIFFLAIGKTYQPELSQAENSRIAVEDAIRRINRARQEGVEVLEARHRTHWHSYYRQAWVGLPDDPAWEKFYWAQIYKFGAAARPDVPIIIDNMGPWYTQCGWAGTWWNLNMQLSYFPTFSGNRMDVGYSMIHALDHFYATGVLQTEENPEAITLGRYSTYFPRKEGGKSHEELGNFTWALHNYWRYYRYSMDKEVGRNLFNLLKGDINYYFDVIERDAEGKIHIPPMISPEYNVPKDATWAKPKLRQMGPIRDINYTLQLFDWGLSTLIELNDTFELHDPEREKWVQARDDLIDFPVGENGLKISADVEYLTSHRHHSHLIALYPLHTINPDQGLEAEALFRKSFDHWFSMPEGFANFSYVEASCMFSTLGEGDKALKALDGLFENAFNPKLKDPGAPGPKPNTMFLFGGGPAIESPLAAVEAFNYMLLQSWGGVLRIFPAVPSAWQNVAFRDLRAEGAFLISAERIDGETRWIQIKSLAGEPCIFETDIEFLETFGDKAHTLKKEKGPRGQERWTLDLEKGDCVWLRPMSKPMSCR